MMKATSNFDDFVKLLKILRQKCPWDRKQTHDSLKDHLIEETYETVDAIDRQDWDELEKELGDLLLQVVFHSQIAAESGDFMIDDVIRSIQEKMVRRHPHVFGEAAVKNEHEVARNWEIIKRDEGRDSALEGIPENLPALMQAQRMQEKAGSVGFDWKKSIGGKRQLWNKLQEELDEFKEVYEQDDETPERMAEEYGDLLFSLVNAGRFLNLQAEDALRLTNKKFQRRFHYVEDQIKKSGHTLGEVSLEEMEVYWQEAKSFDHEV